MWGYNVWSGKKSFLSFCLAGTTEFDRPLCKNFELHNFGILHHVNAHHVEHTQMHLVLKKGTKNFHYTSNSWGIFSVFSFLWNEIPMVDMKVQVDSNFSPKKKGKKWNLQAPRGMEDFTLPSVGARFKK
jgi:hypothetical protein